MRDHLFDIDLLLGRTLLYGSLTAIVAVIFLGSVLVLQQVLRRLIGGPNELAVAAAALVNGLLFQPLRRRLQTWLDRRLHRRSLARAEVLAALSSRLEAEEVSLEDLEVRLRAAVDEGLHPVSLGVWLGDQETD